MTILEKTFNLGEENIRIKVEFDENGLNPRTDWDGNASEMICFHSRYSLGDDHNYSSPENFLVSLIQENIQDTEKEELLYKLFEKLYPNLRAEIDYEDESFDLNYDYITYDKKIVECGYESYNISDMDNIEDEIADAKYEMFLDIIDNSDELENLHISELLDVVNNLENIVILPLYLYDHSGITMNTTRFSCDWDSGQVGWIYNSIEAFKKETGNNDWTKEQIEEDFKSQVKLYDQYIRGNIYQYNVEKEVKCECCSHVEYEHVDSCGGFFDGETLIGYVLDNIEESKREKVKSVLESELKYI